MLKKDTVVFALYVATSVAITAHAGVEIWKTFKREKTATVIPLKEAPPERLISKPTSP